jgi:hypothetical protein
MSRTSSATASAMERGEEATEEAKGGTMTSPRRVPGLC